tara:strand:+ start:67 stop:693 length:627 start_codon:yes stop_codon:yes gene_type:complete
MKLVHGVGINDLRDDPSYITIKKINGNKVWRCPFYIRWKSVVKRCYCKSFLQTRPTYRGCSMCEEWKTFSNFMAWMKTQPWEGKQLDKDILIPGNKVYSPETCVFVSGNLNNLLLNRGNDRGDLPIGISISKKQKNLQKKFRVQINKYGKLYLIGLFNTKEEAYEVYKKERSKYILEIAENLTEDDTSDVERTRQGLIRHVEEGLIFK